VALSEDISKVKKSTWTKVRKNYLSREDFVLELVKKSSLAAGTLLIWLQAADNFEKVKKQVKPLEQSLSEAQAKLQIVEADLAVAQGNLREVQQQVADLKAKFDGAIKKEKKLKDDESRATRQLGVAGKLLSGLSAESKRWVVKLKDLEEDEFNLPGNMLLGACLMAYLGPFIITYRDEMMRHWAKELIDCKIPCMAASDFSLERILSDPLQIREW
jgi:dynein heavy chain, axonemal